MALKNYHRRNPQGAGGSSGDASLRRGQEVCGTHGIGLGPSACQPGVGGWGQTHGADHHHGGRGRHPGASLGVLQLLQLLVVMGQLAVEGDGIGSELGQVFGAAVPGGAERGGGIDVVLSTVKCVVQGPHADQLIKGAGPVK